MGEVTRRAALARGARLAGGVAAGLSLPALLAACDADERGPQAEEVLRTSIAVDLASYYAPFPDLKRLTLAHAKQLGVQVLFSADPAGSRAQVDSVTRVTGPKGGFQVIAIGAFDAATIEPVAQAALAKKLQIVSFLTPLEHQTGGIVFDHAAAARQLIAAAGQGRGRGVLLVVPPPAAPVPDPFFPVATANAGVLKELLPSSGLGAPVATVEAVGSADAEASVTNALAGYPEVDVILTANDTTALGAAKALAAVRGAAGARRAFVGALGAPSITSPATLDALDSGGALKLVVAPRLLDLATALVDVPNALLQGGDGKVVTVPARRYARRNPYTAAARADFV